MTITHLYKAIDNAQVVSFDVFDTLLVRPYLNPTDVFSHMERIRKVFGFAQRRVRAESVFYKKFGRNRVATLDNIYDQIPDFVDMKQAELDWEWQTITANDEMKPFYDYTLRSGKTVIICSDMYLPYDFVAKLLTHNGFTGYSKLFVSATAGVTKSAGGGSLFDLVARTLGVEPSAILHIGDNRKSDYRQAKRHGFRAFWYETRVHRELKANKKFRKLFLNLGDSLGFSVCGALYLQRQKTSDYWVEFGYKYAGPIVYAFSRFIYNIAQDMKLDKILFVARDGYLIQKVFNTFNTAGIKTAYVYAPRMLMMTSYLLYDCQRETHARIICDYFHKDYGEYFSAQDCIDRNIDEFIRLANEDKEKTKYDEYIRKITGNSQKIGVVVDVSQYHSAQYLIEKETGVKTVGFYFFTDNNENLYTNYNFFSEETTEIFCSCRKTSLLEFILSAPENPVLDIKNGEIIYQIKSEEQKNIEVARKLEAGVMQFACDVKKHFGENDIYLSKIDILELFNIYAKSPQKEDFEAMLGLQTAGKADNSNYVPIFAGRFPFYKIFQIPKLYWFTPLQKLELVLLWWILVPLWIIKQPFMRPRIKRIIKRIFGKHTRAAEEILFRKFYKR